MPWGIQDIVGKQLPGLSEAEVYSICCLIREENGKWKMPKKKDLRLLLVSKPAALYLGEAMISFNETDHSVIWDVPDNNHACDRAHEHPIAKIFFRMLGEVEWTKGSGGEIVGNNEYNRDNAYAGGGANYVVRRFPVHG